MDNKTVNQLIPVLYAALIGCWTASADATDYYLDNTNGNNSWTGTAETFIGGTPTVGPWQNFDRIKASSFSSGDKIYLRRGSQWSGELISADTAGITIQNYGDATDPLPALEAMTNIGSEYVENYNLEIFTPDPTNNRLDNFSGKWLEQLGDGASNSIRSSNDTRNNSGVSIKLTHDGGSSPQLSNTSLVGLAADSALEYNFWIKVVDGQANVRIYTSFSSFYDNTGNWVPNSTPYTTIDSKDPAEWTQITVPVTTPGFKSTPTINFYSSSADTEIYLDDFTLSTKWTPPDATSNIYRRMMVTPNAAAPRRVQVNGVDVVASNDLAELQSLPANDPSYNGSWAWESNERLFYMYFDSLESQNAANIRVNKTDRSLIVVTAPNVVIDGVRLENGGGGIHVRADNATIRNCEVDNMLGNAMFIGDDNAPFYNMNISNNTVSTSGVGIYLLNIHDSIVDANTVTNIAIPLSTETDNESIALQSGTNNTFSNNIIDGGIQGIGVWGSTPDPNPEPGPDSHADYHPANNNFISGNVISNMDVVGILMGGFLEGVANNLIHHNIIHSCGLQTGSIEKAAGIRQNKNGGPLGINYYVHNVLYNNKNSFSGESDNYNDPENAANGSGVTANFEFSNNISVNPTLRHIQLGHVQLGNNQDVTGSSVMKNNLFYPQERSGDVLFSWNALFSTLDDFQAMTASGTGTVTGNIGADPLFVNAPGFDFHLTPDSPAIEVGASFLQMAINTWQVLLGQPDIGVFEYGAADSDGDGLSDYDERCHDGDCVNYDPYNSATNPTGTDLNINLADSDGDGVNDGDEITAGTDPLNAASTPAISAPAMGLAALFILWIGFIGVGIRRSLCGRKS